MHPARTLRALPAARDGRPILAERAGEPLREAKRREVGLLPEQRPDAGGAGPFFALGGIPFVIIGLYFIFGRFIYKARRKRRTIYAVTNQRVMTIVTGRHDESVEATYLRSIPTISTSAVSSGCGSVEFGRPSPMAGWYGNSGMEFFARGQTASSGVSFYDIEDPRGVADMVERLRDEELRHSSR